ncbi:MAG: TIGR02588 family protein [Microcoleaceae cyanobacterium]
MSKDASKSNPKRRRSFPERMSFAASILVLTTLICLIVYQWRFVDSKPPILSVIVDQKTRYYGNQYYVPFTVYNTGGQTAKAVQVMGELQIQAENIQQTGEQQIDFLSGGETVSGAFIFTENPEQGQLKIRVASYKLP